MRIAIAAATLIAIVGSALAADAPTMDQCKMGWKADYSKMWTKADFKKACDSMMKSGGKM